MAKRRISPLYGGLLILVMFVATVGVATVMADYTGPARRTKTVAGCTKVYRYYDDLYVCSFPGGAGLNVCGDQCSNHPTCSNFVCNDLKNGGGNYYTKDETQTITLPNATVDASFQCGTPGNNGWCRGGADLHVTANEPVSGYVIEAIETDAWGHICYPNTASPTCDYALPDGQGTANVWAESSYGDSSTQKSVPWKVDTAAPTLTASVPTPDGNNGWYVSPSVSVNANGSDAMSGLAAVQCRVDGGAWQDPPVDVNGDGSHSVDCRAEDNAGNTAIWSQTVKIDATAPALAPAATAAPNGQNGWYTGSVTLRANAADATSGLATVQYQVDGGGWQSGATVNLTTDGVHTVVFKAKDMAGNTTTSQPVTVKIDATAPTLTPSMPEPDGNNGWFVTAPVQISASAEDTTSGVASLQCRIDGGAWQAPPVSVMGDGEHVVECKATDNAGNVADWTQTLRVDTTAPSVAPSEPMPDGDHDWFVTAPVQIGASADDATSGLASLQCRVDGGAWQNPPVDVTGDGSHSVDCRAEDNAGNTATWSDTVKVDTTPPMSAFHEPAEGATVWGVVTLQGESDDPTSGPAAVEVSTDGGKTWSPATLAASTGQWTAFWDTRPLPDGEYTLMARAKDEAGNEEHTAIVHVTVANAPPQIHLAPQSWYFWQTAQAGITPNPYIPLKAVTVRVLGPPGYVREWNYGAVQRVNIHWNSRWYSETGPWAHPGTYRVVVKAVDIYGHSSQVEGRVIVPEPAPTATPTPTPTATWTPTPTMTPTATSPATPVPPTATVAPAHPTPTPRQAVGAAQASLPPSEAHPDVLWLLGAVLAVGLSLVFDPRPREVRALTQSLAHVLEDDHD